MRERRSMHVHNMVELEAMVKGYYSALHHHGLTEDGPLLTERHFGFWLSGQTDWSTCSGWGYAFEQNTSAGKDVFDSFFSFVDQFRRLVPTVTARVTLGPDHQPTGKRCIIGFDKRMDRPDQVEIVNYFPTSLNHFRFHYGNSYVDERFLTLCTGKRETRQSDFFDWLSDEFGVEQSEWTILTNPEKSHNYAVHVEHGLLGSSIGKPSLSAW